VPVAWRDHVAGRRKRSSGWVVQLRTREYRRGVATEPAGEQHLPVEATTWPCARLFATVIFARGREVGSADTAATRLPQWTTESTATFTKAERTRFDMGLVYRKTTVEKRRGDRRSP